MGALRGRLTRFPVPDEPGEWMAFKRLSARDLDERQDLAFEQPKVGENGSPLLDTEGQPVVWRFLSATPAEQFAFALRWLTETLVAWSYDEPCVEQTWRDHLDRPTLVWALMKAVGHSLGRETPEEKKADSPASTAISTAIPTPPVPTTGS